MIFIFLNLISKIKKNKIQILFMIKNLFHVKTKNYVFFNDNERYNLMKIIILQFAGYFHLAYRLKFGKFHGTVLPDQCFRFSVSFSSFIITTTAYELNCPSYCKPLWCACIRHRICDTVHINTANNEQNENVIYMASICVTSSKK